VITRKAVAPPEIGERSSVTSPIAMHLFRVWEETTAMRTFPRTREIGASGRIPSHAAMPLAVRGLGREVRPVRRVRGVRARPHRSAPLPGALEQEIAAAIRAHPDGEIFLSLFKNGFVTAAEPCAEIGDCRGRHRPATRSPAAPSVIALCNCISP
jgi:hypothetical protein